VPHVASPTKPYTVKPAQPQTIRPPQANDRPQAAFESMIDDNAANTPASAKNQRAEDRTQSSPPAKAKPGKRTNDAKPADGQTPPKAAKADKADKPAEAGKTDATDKPAAEAKADDDAPTEPATNPVVATAATGPTAGQAPATIIMPDGTLAVALPAQTPAEAPPATATATTEEPQAPVIAALAGEMPIDPAAKQDKGAPASKDKPAAAAQTADGEGANGKPAAQAQPANGKAPHVALSDAEKELVASARGEAADNPRRTANEGPAQADTQPPAVKAVTDLPPPQLHTPAHATPGAAASAATANAAAPQTAAQTPVPLAGVPVEIATKARDGKTNFDIRLDPPELGRIEVRLNIDRDGNVTSRLIADRPDTLDLLRRDSSGLERALQDAGLKTSDNGMQFSLRDQSLSQQQDNGNKNSADTAHVIAQDDTLPIIDTPVQSYGRLAGRSGGLDIRV